ncbi:MAG: NADH:ubiquinone oxidoreductase [Chloroflexi bacterium]|jgi:coenzyme F420-reducing hydrogenase gamma subunit|nr:NADH:ubiquinone oxidoreductase [Chloroflexota bacterium]
MKPRVAFFDFTGCEGCQLEVLNFNLEIVDLINAVDIVEFREASSDHSDEYDIAFIEGSQTTQKDIERIQQIRERAKILVALGACSCTGGVNALKNRFSMEENLKVVYGESAKYYNTLPTRPTSAYVKVDVHLHGCPPNRNEVISLVKCLLTGKKFEQCHNPVCVECKLAENICAFERGEFCLGPVTRGGCDAVCVTAGRKCWGCRAMVDEPNVNSEKDILKKYGLTMEDMMLQFKLFNGALEVSK